MPVTATLSVPSRTAKSSLSLSMDRTSTGKTLSKYNMMDTKLFKN